MNYLIEHLQEYSRKKPNDIFLRDEGKTWSFDSFYQEVAKFSTFLLDRGIQNGDAVLIHLDEKSEHLISYMALLNIGAISVHLYPERENDYVRFAADHTKAKAVISNKFKEEIEDTLLFDFPKEYNCKPTYTIDYNEIAYIMFTSGTTSSPKAVLTTHENIKCVTDTLMNLADMRQGKEKELILLPLGSTGGLGHFHASIFLGNYIRLFPGLYSMLDSKKLDRLLDYIDQDDITGVLLTPGLITRLLHFHKEKFQTCAKNLRYSLANVTPMKKETIQELLDLLPDLRFCTYYGSTEASRSVVNVCRESKEFMHLTGKVAKGIEVQIKDQNQNGEGEIYIKGANVMKGYLGRDDSLDDGWFATGDMAKIDEHGYVRVLGRIKDTISVDGLKVFPMEIENIAMGHQAVAEAGVCTLEKDFLIQIGFAVVLKDKNIHKEEVTQELYKMFRAAFKCDKTDLYSYKIPQEIYFVDQIPRSGLGKIDRAALQEMLNDCKDVLRMKGEDDTKI